MRLCPFESVCTFANSERLDPDDIILREVFCEVHPEACVIFRRILEEKDNPREFVLMELRGVRRSCLSLTLSLSHARLISTY